MRRIETKIRTNDPEFQENLRAYESLVSALRSRLKAAQAGGPEDQRQRHHERGKLLARERIDALVDPETPFLELSPLAANGMFNNEAPSAGIATGIGLIHGRET